MKNKGEMIKGIFPTLDGNKLMGTRLKTMRYLERTNDYEVGLVNYMYTEYTSKGWDEIDVILQQHNCFTPNDTKTEKGDKLLKIEMKRQKKNFRKIV